jgi:hypothetical protein
MSWANDRSKAIARISWDRRQGSFFPVSRLEMKGLPSPVWTARYV